MTDIACLTYIVCYDIPDDKRRAKLATRLDSYGDRIQYSVFEARLDGELFDFLLQDIRKLIDIDEDRVHIFALCAGCFKRRVVIGYGSDIPPPGTEEVFVV